MAAQDQPHEQFIFPEEVLPRGNALVCFCIFLIVENTTKNFYLLGFFLLKFILIFL